MFLAFPMAKFETMWKFQSLMILFEFSCKIKYNSTKSKSRNISREKICIYLFILLIYFIPNLSKFHWATPSISPTVTIFVQKTIDFAPKLSFIMQGFIWKEMSRGSKRSQTLEPVQKSWNFSRRPGKSWNFHKNRKLKSYW